MTYRLPPLQQLQAFEAAARHLSFKAAAAELHVTPTAISHAIRALEKELGVTLFRRLTRAIVLTDAAEAALMRLREGFNALAQAVDALRRSSPGRALTVVAPPFFAMHWLVPRLQSFTAVHPEVTLHIATSDAMLDQSEEGPGDPLAGMDAAAGPVVAVHFGAGSYPGYRVTKLVTVGYIPVCSPRLLEGPAAIRAPADLARCTLLHDEAVRAEVGRPSWDKWFKVAGISGVDARRGPRFANATVALEAAADGLGVALTIRELAAADLAAGRLVAPFPQVLPSRFAYYLVCQDAVADLPEVAALRALLLQATAAPAPPAAAPGPRRSAGASAGG